jgi:L-fuconate dehydratase
MFKQFIMEGALDIVQIDSCRMGGLNEVLAVMLMAAKYGLPVWPHAGGVGLCEYVQHMAMIDYISISGEKDDRRIEYVDHLHEHFEDPCVVKKGAYQVPSKPGFSIQIKSTTFKNFTFKT